MPTQIGLTLGKFAPFHKGHQLIIDRATREMDLVYVLIYDSPDITDISLDIRANWIRIICPGVIVIECYDHPKEDGYTEEIKRSHEEYIGKKMAGIKVTDFYSNEPYGEHVSKFLGARDIRWGDKNICATFIRKDPYQYRFFLHPFVYRDYVTKICFLGAESSGKSTITKEMAMLFGTSYMKEYGADYWLLNNKDGKLTLEQLETLATIHREMEESYLYNAKGFFFTDTSAITTRMFSNHYHGSATWRLNIFAEEASQKYDFVFLCDIDIPYEDTWDRSGIDTRKKFHESLILELKRNKVPYILLSGDLKTRTDKVFELITTTKKAS